MSSKGKQKAHCLRYFNERRREINKARRLEALKRKATRRGWAAPFITQLNTAIARCDELRRNPSKQIKAVVVEKTEEAPDSNW